MAPSNTPLTAAYEGQDIDAFGDSDSELPSVPGWLSQPSRHPQLPQPYPQQLQFEQYCLPTLPSQPIVPPPAPPKPKAKGKPGPKPGSKRNTPAQPSELRQLPQLNKTDKITVLRTALNYKRAFGAPGQTDKKFWERVAKEVADKSEPKRPPHQTLGRSIKALVETRIRELEEDESGTQEGRDELQIALDAWVEVVVARTRRVNARDEREFDRDDKARETEIFRQDQLNLYDRKSFRQDDKSSESLELSEDDDEQPSRLSSTPAPRQSSSGTPAPRGRSRSRGGSERQARKRRAIALVEEEEREKSAAFDAAFTKLVGVYTKRVSSLGGGGGGVSLERLEAVESKLGGLEQNVSEVLNLLRTQERRREEARRRRAVEEDKDLL